MKKSLMLGVLILSGMLCQAQDAGTNELYNSKCSKCHAKDGSGNTLMGKKYSAKNYTDASVQSKVTDEAIDKSLKEGYTNAEGKKVMQAFPELTALERKELIKTMRSFKK